MNIYYYEDNNFQNFFPITILRPVYLQRNGIVPLYKKAQQKLEFNKIGFVCREQISRKLSQENQQLPVNIIKFDESDLLFVNGRISSFNDLPVLILKSEYTTLFRNKSGETAAVLFKSVEKKSLPSVGVSEDYQNYFNSIKNNIIVAETTAELYKYNWEIMSDISSSIIEDFEFLKTTFTPAHNIKIHDAVHMINEDFIHLSDDVELKPNSLLDASKGPIYIAPNVTIESQAAINGPCFVGANSTVLAGKLSNSSIGHTCKVGGEVEDSIFHAYVNKYHDGFIGHSYIGEWVNFGAMTTNSDLKNNYSNIRLSLNGENIDSGSMKVGSFIGDHTKFGIGTLLNTGINIGMCCNLFGGSLITDKEVSSFSWGNSGNYSRYQIEKAIETIKTVLSRRDVELKDYEQELFKAVYEDNISPDGILDFKL